MDGWTDRQMDGVIPVCPLQLVEAGIKRGHLRNICTKFTIFPICSFRKDTKIKADVNVEP